MTIERPRFFVVVRQLGRSTPILYWDELPRAPIRNLEYVLRLDVLPTATRLVNASLAELFATYQALKSRGKLPPRWEPPKPTKREAPTAAVST